MQSLTMDLERIGRFRVCLVTDLAPLNCRALLERLPLALSLRHSMFSGAALEGRIPGVPAVAENPHWFEVPPGTLGVECPIPGQPDNGLGLVLVYGTMFQYRTAHTPLGAPLYVLGRVEGDLDALANGGRRYQEQGEGGLRLSKGW